MNPTKLPPALLLTLMLTVGCASSAAPRGPAPVGAPPPPSRSIATGLESPPGPDASIVAEASVRSHMTFLAADALNGRGSGTRDEWIAAEYLGAQMHRWGVEPLGDNAGYVQEI